METLRDGNVCPSPPVFTLSSWAESLAVQIRMLRCLEIPDSLDPWSGLQSWAQAASRHLKTSGRSFQLAAARQARSADRLINQWCIDENSPWLDERFNSMRWSVQQKLIGDGIYTSENWLSDLTDLLNKHEQPLTRLPRSISLKGFVEHTTLELQLFDALRSHEVEVNPKVYPADQYQARTRKFATPEDEWQAAACWAQSQMQQGARRLAIVIDSSLTARGHASRRIRQVLSAVFHPWPSACLRDTDVSEFYVPAARHLSDCRTISDAQMLLHISLQGVRADLEFPTLGRLLLSPAWAGSREEKYRRASLEIQLREAGIYQFSLLDLKRLAVSKGFEKELPLLIEKITHLPARPDPANAGIWIHEVLKHWEWPGQSEQAQLSREAEELSSLIESLNGMRFGSVEQALETLDMMIAGTTLSEGGGPLSAVQVIEPEVAAAGCFDAVWVCHLDDTNWPPPMTINPYLPASAQKLIPRMNPDGHFEYYERLTRMLCASAEEVIFSWSVDGGQGKRNCSSLIAAFKSDECDAGKPIRLAQRALDFPSTAADESLRSRLMQIEDEQGIAFPDNGQILLHGGSGFFRMQAACPLAGYLRYRLSARFPTAPTLLASPQLRGELLHQALRELYRQSAQDGSKPGPDDVPAAVKAALIRLHASDRLTASGCKAEEQRLIILLKEWLLLDLRRDEFQIVALEETLRLELGRVVVNIRPDRLDRLGDGSFMVIDYKSGGSRSRALKWTLPRIQEPQLPLYAILLEAAGANGDPGGLAFAIVKRGECGFDGMAANLDVAFSGIRIAGQKGRGGLPGWEWPELIQHWRAQLETISQEIQAGAAQNRVYDPDIVGYSGLGLILRYAEAEKLEGRLG